MVEIDESLMAHFNDIEGKHESWCWAVGIYDRAIKRSIFVAVCNKRTEDIIREIILTYVANDPDNPTKIYTDSFST